MKKKSSVTGKRTGAQPPASRNAEASQDSSPRYQALLRLLRTAENLWNTSRTFFDRWDLGPSQFNVLNLLAQNPDGLSQIEISRMLIMHRSNATGLIDRLEERGLLQRRNTPGDRRTYQVVLTPAARRLLEQILPDYYRLAEVVWGDLAAARIRQFLDDLTRLDDTLAELRTDLAK